MNDMKIFSIGKIMNNDETVCIKLDRKYSAGLKGLDGYSHIQVLWWADKCDNPVAVSNVRIASVNVTDGVVGLYYIDAFDGTEVIDIKPYVPSIDRIEKPAVPDWCSHWPKSYEESGDFDWEEEFNFQSDAERG